MAAGAAIAGLALLVLTGQGCQDQATPASMMDGAHNITKSMRGFWDSPGGAGCNWRKFDRFGNPTGHGGGSRSQTVLLVSSDVGGKFKSDRCKLWSPK
jgi:hypothetical protein